MKIKYDVYEMPDAGKEKGKKKYYARVVNTGTLTTNELASIIEYGTTLTSSDVKAVLSSLIYQMEEALKQGKRVHLEGLGYFQLKICSDPVENPASMRAEAVHFKTIGFLPEQRLKKVFKRVEFVRSKHKHHSACLTDEEMEHKLFSYLDTHFFITRAHFQELCGYTKNTALNKLNTFIKEGKIKKEGNLKSPVYIRRK